MLPEADSRDSIYSMRRCGTEPEDQMESYRSCSVKISTNKKPSGRGFRHSYWCQGRWNLNQLLVSPSIVCSLICHVIVSQVSKTCPLLQKEATWARYWCNTKPVAILNPSDVTVIHDPASSTHHPAGSSREQNWSVSVREGWNTHSVLLTTATPANHGCGSGWIAYSSKCPSCPLCWVGISQDKIFSLYSVIFSKHFILVRMVVDPQSIPGILGLQQK